MPVPHYDYLKHEPTICRVLIGMAILILLVHCFEVKSQCSALSELSAEYERGAVPEGTEVSYSRGLVMLRPGADGFVLNVAQEGRPVISWSESEEAELSFRFVASSLFWPFIMAIALFLLLLKAKRKPGLYAGATFSVFLVAIYWFLLVLT